jgi:hypothetical protein
MALIFGGFTVPVCAITKMFHDPFAFVMPAKYENV